MKTDSFFYRFFSLFPASFFVLIGESGRKAAKYNFESVEIKELSFRIDGIFLPNSSAELIRFLEVQFKKEDDFYSRFFGEIFLYLRQNLSENDWSAVVIFPTEKADPGVHRRYREFFESGRLQMIYLNNLPEKLLSKFPLNLLKIIIAPKKDVPAIVETIVRQLPKAITDKKQQEIIADLLIGLLLQKLKTLTREEVRKMVEPMLSDIRESRFYQEIAEEIAEEERHSKAREIATTMLKKEMAIELITELTGLSVDEVLEISKQLAQQRNGKPA